MEIPPRRGRQRPTPGQLPRRTLLRSLGGAAAGVGAVGVGATIGAGHEQPTPDENAADSDDGDVRTPDPDSYEPLATLSLPGTKEVVTDTTGTTGYAAVTDGYATIDLSEPESPVVLAERRNLLTDRADGPLRRIHDLAHEGDRLAVVGPANPVSEGINAVLLLDVSDPADPRRVSVHETAFPIHNCTIRNGNVYLTANGATGNPLVILDGRDDLLEVGRWSLADHDERWHDVDPSLRALHDVWVHDEVAYLAHWDAGTWLLDVSDPSEPTYLADVGGVDREELAMLDRPAARRESTTPPGNSHYVATDPEGDLLAVGSESWAHTAATDGPSGIDLYDCTDPTAPERLSHISPPPSPDPTRTGLWTTAHNFDIVGDVLYSSWYRGGVKRHDVSDPANPRELTWWREPGAASFWTAQAAVPGEYFVAADMSLAGASGVAADAGVYVFPDEDGTQSPPPEPALTAEADSEMVTKQTATPPSTAESRHPSTTTPTAGGSSLARAPGLGIGAALFALGVGAASWLRRTREP